MTTAELAAILRRKYDAPPSGKKTVEIHLFGIKYAEALKGVSVDEVVERAGISKNYATELRKMINVAPYVDVKQRPPGA
jgi:hypothetical protein